jgi:hypothetical protein
MRALSAVVRVLVVAVAAVVAEVLVVVVVDVCVVVCEALVDAGGGVAGAVRAGEVEVDLEPPQPASKTTPRRNASLLTFAG